MVYFIKVKSLAIMGPSRRESRSESLSSDKTEVRIPCIYIRHVDISHVNVVPKRARYRTVKGR